MNFSSESGTDIEDNNESDCDLPVLIAERSTETNELPPKGRRIVDIGHVMKQVELVASHSKHYSMGKYKYKKERKNGLFCTWIYYCDNCENEYTVTSEPLCSKNGSERCPGVESHGSGHRIFSSRGKVQCFRHTNHGPQEIHQPWNKSWQCKYCMLIYISSYTEYVYHSSQEITR